MKLSPSATIAVAPEPGSAPATGAAHRPAATEAAIAAQADAPLLIIGRQICVIARPTTVTITARSAPIKPTPTCSIVRCNASSVC